MAQLVTQGALSPPHMLVTPQTGPWAARPRPAPGTQPRLDRYLTALISPLNLPAIRGKRDHFLLFAEKESEAGTPWKRDKNPDLLTPKPLFSATLALCIYFFKWLPHSHHFNMETSLPNPAPSQMPFKCWEQPTFQSWHVGRSGQCSLWNT